jgi:hypothetical protein
MVNFRIDKAQHRKMIREIKQLSEKQAEKEYAKIVGKAVAPIVEDMKLYAPTADNDNIVNNIGVTKAKKWTKDGSAVRVGVIKNNTTSLRNFSAQALASTIEYGTVERVRNLSRTLGIVTGGVRTGKVTARPWLRPAWDRGESAMIARVEKAIEDLAK